ncbi:MAG TPA: replicative DNA helicase [Chthoniobacterales bacterium]
MPDDSSASAQVAENPQTSRKSRGTAGTGKSGNGSYSQSYLPDTHRTIPHSSDAELGVLCSAFLNPREVLDECILRLTAGHFYIPAHATVFELMVEMQKRGVEIDAITVTQHLRDRKQLDQVGGVPFLNNLFTFVPTAANFSFYIEILREKFLLRQIIITCTECAAASYDEQQDVATLLDDVERKVFAITEERVNQKVPTMRENVMAAIESIEQLFERRGKITGLETGFTDLDRMTDGLHPSEMIVIAARPSMGKTAFAMNIAEHVAVNEKKAVAVFSLEMSVSQLTQRLLGSLARVNLRNLRDGFLSQRDFPALTEAGAKLSSAKMFIDDSSSLSVLELAAKARRLKAQHDIELIVIDYLQLLRSTSRRAQDNRQLEISEISNGVKALAKELKIPIIVLAQLNRQSEKREGNKPRLSDLRESGSIEQDADVVGLLMRSEYYADDDESKAEAQGLAELIIAKQRNGPVGEVPLTFLKEFTRFENRARTDTDSD